MMYLNNYGRIHYLQPHTLYNFFKPYNKKNNSTFCYLALQLKKELRKQISRLSEVEMLTSGQDMEASGKVKRRKRYALLQQTIR